MLKIDQIEYYLPKNQIRNKDLLKINPDWDIESLKKKQGFRVDSIQIKTKQHLILL